MRWWLCSETLSREAGDRICSARSAGQMVRVRPWLIFFFIFNGHRPTQTDTDEKIFSAADIVAGKIVGPAGKMIKKS